MTADGPFEFTLYQLSGHKWVNADVETETSGGIIPMHYKRTSAVNAIQWSIGLELALMIKDPWKIFMTTDHPNGGPFFAYPKIIAWLISNKARMATLKRCHKKGQKKSLLPNRKPGIKPLRTSHRDPCRTSQSPRPQKQRSPRRRRRRRRSHIQR